MKLLVAGLGILMLLTSCGGETDRFVTLEPGVDSDYPDMFEKVTGEELVYIPFELTRGETTSLEFIIERYEQGELVEDLSGFGNSRFLEDVINGTIGLTIQSFGQDDEAHLGMFFETPRNIGRGAVITEMPGGAWINSRMEESVELDPGDEQIIWMYVASDRPDGGISMYDIDRAEEAISEMEHVLIISIKADEIDPEE
ncbi:hypothetical protein FLK61_25020 [Paenalkalicoccus suaedae]|uniref:Uncharacterized protein n=1 Tax=Paenalkalicoccus suaedae TaxID=2592382 RepID=A0A859FB57_9BACI|nr:hypothetical protein [Paenalkalicoccus suaedae]QKS70038.1 hypothetical protein FLK61_25020 [Paenalkalicoccus suaedae]